VANPVQGSVQSVRTDQLRTGALTGIFSDLLSTICLLGWRLAALAVLSLVILTVAYQGNPHYSVAVGTQADASYVQGFHARETVDGHTYRWSGGNPVLLMQSVGYPYRLSLSINGYRPDGKPAPVRLSVNGHLVADFQAAGGFRTYDFDIQGIGFNRGPLVVSLDTTTFQTAGDSRLMGIAIEEAHVTPLPANGLLVVPPPLHLGYFTLGLCLLMVAGVSLGLKRKLWPVFAALPLVAAFFLLRDPLTMAAYYEEFFLGGLFILLFTVLSRAGAYRLLAGVFAVLLLLGVGFSAAPALFIVLALFTVFLTLTRPAAYSGMALVIGLSTFVIVPLFLPGVLINSDQPIHLFWVSELDNLFSQGVFYTRWAPDQSYGFGGPIFNFYAPLSWYMIEGFHLAGMGFVGAMKAVLAVSVLVGMSGMYLFAREHLKQPGPLVAAVCFGYFPYFVADIQLRGEIGEPLAIGLVPLILWSFHRLVVGRSWRYLPVAGTLFALLMLAHNITSLFTAAFLALYLLFIIVREYLSGAAGRKLRRTMHQVGLSAGGLALGMGASAFFWVPAIIEKKYIWGGLPPLSKTNPWAFKGYYMPTDWIYSLHVSDLYMENGRHHPVGIFYWLTAIAIVGLVIHYRGKFWRTVLPFFAALFPLLAFLQVEQSEIIWQNLPLVAFIQFPWRLLFLSMICISMLIGAAVALLVGFFESHRGGVQRREWLAYLPATVLVAVIIPLTMIPLQPGFDQREVNYNSRTENLAGASDMRTKGQFMPVWVNPSSIKPKELGQPITIDGSEKLTVVSTGPQGVNEAEWRVSMTKAGQVTFAQNYFPGWQVYSDSKPVETFPLDGSGLVAAKLPAGEQTVTMRFESNPLRTASEYLSLITLLGIVGIAGLCIVVKSRKKRIQ
jgi:hypothetical protein